jgi:hypothetical protein
MANAFYTSALKAFLDADIDLLTDTIKVQMIDAADYSFSAAHDCGDRCNARIQNHSGRRF